MFAMKQTVRQQRAMTEMSVFNKSAMRPNAHDQNAPRLSANSHEDHETDGEQRSLVVAKQRMRTHRASQRAGEQRCIMVNAFLCSARANIIERSLTEHLALCRACCVAFSSLVSARSPLRR
jgi:hypothetical protein